MHVRVKSEPSEWEAEDGSLGAVSHLEAITILRMATMNMRLVVAYLRV